MSKVSLHESDEHKKAKEIIDKTSKKALREQKLTNLFFTISAIFIFFMMHPLALMISGFGQIEFNKAMMIAIVVSAITYIALCKWKRNHHQNKMKKIKDKAGEEISKIEIGKEEISKSKMSFFKG